MKIYLCVTSNMIYLFLNHSNKWKVSKSIQSFKDRIYKKKTIFSTWHGRQRRHSEADNPCPGMVPTRSGKTLRFFFFLGAKWKFESFEAKIVAGWNSITSHRKKRPAIRFRRTKNRNLPDTIERPSTFWNILRRIWKDNFNKFYHFIDIKSGHFGRVRIIRWSRN